MSGRLFGAGLLAFAVTSHSLAEPPELIDKIVPDDSSAFMSFGSDVAIEEDVFLVGAMWDSETDYRAGAAYIFDTGTGEQIRKLRADDGQRDDFFGDSVAINAAGLAIVGAWGNDDRGNAAGAAYIFNVHTGQQIYRLGANDTEAGDYFGRSVAIGEQWAVATSWGDDDNGDGSGAAYVFDLNTGQQTHKLIANDGQPFDYFGYAVAVYGNLAVITAPFDDDRAPSAGTAYWFDLESGRQLFKVTAADAELGDRFGYSVAIDQERVVIGARDDDDIAEDSGAAYIFDRDTGVQLLKLKAPDADEGDVFGWNVGISGDIAIVGAIWNDERDDDAGAAYLFDARDGTFLYKLTDESGAEDDHFGYSVTIGHDRALVGSMGDGEGTYSPGSAFLYDLPNPQPARLRQANVDHGERVRGRVRSLRRADGKQMKIRAEFRPQRRFPWEVELRTKHKSSVADPRFVHLTIRDRITEPGARGRIEMRNQVTGKWENLRRYAVRNSPHSLSVQHLDAGKYVHPRSGRVDVRIRHLMLTTADGEPFRSFFDLVEIEVE